MPKEKRPCKVTTLICEALCQLIEEKRPYEDISLQEIVDKAGVCRNSFYRNYHSKEDIFKEKFQEVCAESGQVFVSTHELTRYGIILSIATTMARNRSFLLCFYEADPKLYFETLIGQIEASNTTKPLASVEPEVYYTFASQAWVAIGVLTEWLQRGCDLSNEKISKMIDSIITR
jgi:AcrR family transcriptional regulator